jgi:AhpD family alkylhydroperoxidase
VKDNLTPRINQQEVSPGAFQAMLGLEKFVRGALHSERRLLHLIKIRASQINQCAYCIDMHTKDARLDGETEQRIYALNAWRETPFFTDRERAALDWTEAVTLIGESHAPDELYENLKTQFTEQEIVAITMAVVTINAWNRLSISFRAVPGTYQPAQQGEVVAR